MVTIKPMLIRPVFVHGEQIVQEYERAVIYRLGRLVSGGAKGPGMFFILPCIDEYKKVDLRTVSFDVPPQEVRCGHNLFFILHCMDKHR